MFAVKLLGCAAVMTCAIFCAMLLAREYKRQYERVSEYASLIREMGASIDCLNTPLCDIYAELAPTLPTARDIARDGWESCVSSDAAFLCGEADALRGFFSRVGTVSRGEAVALCSLTSRRMGERSDELRASLAQRIKVARTLCAVGGIFVCLIFI
ncbi:MAG: stage III sporulation protein AB [Eubacteriales bacterium]